MLEVLGLANLLDAEVVAAPADVLELLRARERARGARDYAEADRLRDAIRARGWEVRDGPHGPELLPRCDVIVYGRNPVREAIRGPRRVMRVWATHNAGREPWLARASRRPSRRRPRSQQRCGSAEHQGICAEVSAFRYAEPDALLSLPAPLIVALDQVQDPQNLGAICRTAECAGAAGVVLPERRSAEVTPAVCKASAGAVEHLPVARARNLADFLGRGQAGRAVVLRRRRQPARSATTRSTSVARSCWCSGPRGAACAPAWRLRATRWSRFLCHGQIESLSVSAAAAVLLYAAVGAR